MPKTVRIKTEVYCTLQVEGLHQWLRCPHTEVKYLRKLHRHVFHIKANKAVSHDDRDVEFILLKHKIESYLNDKYFSDTYKMCEFGSQSCEMLAKELITKFNLSRCEVSEDGENGAIVVVVDEIMNSEKKFDNTAAMLATMPRAS